MSTCEILVVCGSEFWMLRTDENLLF